MSVRKRTWVAPDGKTKIAWVVDYVDADGKRRLKTHARKADAEAYQSSTAVDLRAGMHTADRASPTVAEAGRLWLKTAEEAGLEATTVTSYREHLKLHIVPLIGSTRLSQLTAPGARRFEDRLRETGRSASMVKKIMSSLGALIADAQERGSIRQNVVRSLRTRRKKGKERQAERRKKGKLKIGIDIPAPEEIRLLIPNLSGRWKPLLLTAIFTGLRASELRGLRWVDVDLKKGKLDVHQRADRLHKIGPPKSESGERSVPIPPQLIPVLREWKLACPNGELGLVFPSGAGGVEGLANIVQRGLQPAMIAAGLVNKPNDKGAKAKAKYTGMHALRHFYASWCINRPANGGLGLSPKEVQERMGHSTIMMTMDTYGHLFPRADDSAELAAAAKTFLG